MSHGGGEGGDTEPNLTPLLDLVLQLVMFFMINANFVMEQVSKDVELPTASMARAQEAKERDTGPIFLNIVNADKYLNKVAERRERETDARGRNMMNDLLAKFPLEKYRSDVFVLMTGKDPQTRAALAATLKSEYRDAKERAGGNEPNTVLIVRADRDVRYRHLFEIMSVCKSAGFKNMQLRAIRDGK